MFHATQGVGAPASTGAKPSSEAFIAALRAIDPVSSRKPQEQPKPAVDTGVAQKPQANAPRGSVLDIMV